MSLPNTPFGRRTARAIELSLPPHAPRNSVDRPMKRVVPPLAAEIDSLRAVNARLYFALIAARTALDAAVGEAAVGAGREFCPRCEAWVLLTKDGEACGQCKLVL